LHVYGNVALLFALLYCAKATSVIKELHIFGIVCLICGAEVNGFVSDEL